MFRDIGMGNVFFKLSEVQGSKENYMNLHNISIVKKTVQQQSIEWDTLYTSIMLTSTQYMKPYKILVKKYI